MIFDIIVESVFVVAVSLIALLLLFVAFPGLVLSLFHRWRERARQKRALPRIKE